METQKNIKFGQTQLFKVAAFVMVIGVGLRLAAYFFTRSLWVDEASLALNILDRSFLSFFQPLDLNQSAPVGFLFVEKAATLLFGIGERALRLFPLLAGIGVLPMMYLVSKKIGGWAMVLTSLTLAAVAKYLIYYSNEVKQYSLDVFVTLLLFYLAIRVLDGEGDTRRRSLRAYIAGGILAVWFSNGALFVFAGLSSALAVVFIARRELWELRFLLLGGLFWLVSVAAVYFAFLRFSQQNNYLFQFWEEGFAPFPPWSYKSWYFTLLKNIAIDPLGLKANWLYYGLLAVGAIRLSIKRWETTILLFAPMAVTLAASMLRIYPFQERLILFLVPLFYLLMGAGLEGIYQLVAKRNKFIGLAVLAGVGFLFLSTPVMEAIKEAQSPANFEDMRPLVMTLRKEAQPEDTIYLYYSAVPAYTYYERVLGPIDGKVIFGGNHRNNVGLYGDEIQMRQGTERFWFVFTHPSKDEDVLYAKALCKTGSLTRKYVDQYDLRLYLFDLSRDGNSDCEIIGAGNTP
jgi:hypothetical protein